MCWLLVDFMSECGFNFLLCVSFIVDLLCLKSIPSWWFIFRGCGCISWEMYRYNCS